jgi:hypothetical protein
MKIEDLGLTVDIWPETIPPTDDAWSKLMIYELYALIHNRLDDIREDMGRTLVGHLDQAKKINVHEEIHHQKEHIVQAEDDTQTSL